MDKRRLLLTWVVLAGCGGTNGGSASDVTAFQQGVAAATQALGTYQAATRSMSSGADCSAAVNAYGTPMQADLDHMTSVSGSMDDHVRSMGQPSQADVGCGVQGMDDELRRHLQVACHDAEMGDNRDEAAQHVAAMGKALQHMQMRAAEVSEGRMDGGWRMGDGGMMEPDDHPMGCPGGPMSDGGMMPGHGPDPMSDGGAGSPMDGGSGPMMDGGPGGTMDGGMGHMP